MKACSVIWILLFTTIHVHCQSNTEGFISLDCGLPSNSSYTDTTTELEYTSDIQYIDTGKIIQISKNYINDSLSRSDQTVRSFPTGDRNCYTFTNLIIDQKYLFRATFYYGNYDGTQAAKPRNPLTFDLYLGVTKWKTVTISDAHTEYRFEAIGMINDNITWICLVDTGTGTPFISALELRPLKNILYPYVSNNISISFYTRLNYGPTTNQITRYPDDPYDRIWMPYPYDTSIWTTISTTATSFSRFDDEFEAPAVVLSTAVTPLNSRNLSFFEWDSEPGPTPPEYMSVRHFSELQNLSANATRIIDSYLNENVGYSGYSPTYLDAGYVYSLQPVFEAEHYKYTLVQNTTSTLPPIINAFELYSVLHVPDTTTATQDVTGIMAIKGQYNVRKENWAGDPCYPSKYIWDAISCTNISGGPARIISVNLSNIGLTGIISDSFSSLEEIKYLDLSYNNLSGVIPESLGTLSHLTVLNLTGNHFTGQIPDSLKKKEKTGFLTLIVDGLCTDDCPSNGSSKKKFPIIIIVVIVVAVVILATVVALLLWLKRRKSTGQQQRQTQQRKEAEATVQQNIDVPRQFIEPKRPEFPTKTRQFSYLDLQNMTNNFTRQIGKGGFGKVYLGYLENGVEIAVKTSTVVTSQGNKQFLNEAKSLTQVHHKNLVSFVGYCKDGNNLGLVYEYMPEGSLHDHLTGKVGGVSRALNWGMRLRIAAEAAQGLDYLHTGCSIVHRDVKSSNILLGQNFEAKISDFGLSKMVGDQNSLASISFCGTPGYMDPELQTSMTPLNEKSDVYSFGVVLLEIITGRPPISPRTENIHIVQYVKRKLKKGNIDEIADSRFQNKYDSNSMWKVVDVALRCTSELSDQRPTMAQVVGELTESLARENHKRGNNSTGEIPSSSTGTTRNLSFSMIGPAAR